MPTPEPRIEHKFECADRLAAGPHQRASAPEHLKYQQPAPNACLLPVHVRRARERTIGCEKPTTTAVIALLHAGSITFRPQLLTNRTLQGDNAAAAAAVHTLSHHKNCIAQSESCHPSAQLPPSVHGCSTYAQW